MLNLCVRVLTGSLGIVALQPLLSTSLVVFQYFLNEGICDLPLLV